MIARFVAVLLLLIAAPAMAADPVARDPTGVWAFHAGGKALFVFEIRRDQQGWSGIWVRPDHFDSDGDSFSNVTGPAVKRQSRSARAIDDGVELSFDDLRPGATPDIFRIRLIDATHADALYVGARMEPFALVRAIAGEPFGGWDPKRNYMRVIERPTNAEMTALFDADQKVRENLQAANWRDIATADRQRRARTEALLDAGALQSGDDYYHAAFVFQHGDKPADYLKAHILATIGAARGKPAAVWIAAATLDRYLQSIGQPQILGTQFQTKDGKTTQQPYNPTLISDQLRQAMRVPPLTEQEVQRVSIERQDSAR